eukprot:scaffold22203_cov64-Phaeocystis_antarctica.AAC.3
MHQGVAANVCPRASAIREAALCIPVGVIGSRRCALGVQGGAQFLDATRAEEDAEHGRIGTNCEEVFTRWSARAREQP